jgi:plastocyanin
MRARDVAVVAGAVAGLALVALSMWGPAAAAPPEVSVTRFRFTPSVLTVMRGTAVTWTNQDDIRHTVTSGAPERRDARFSAELAGPGAASTVTFAEAGVYPYFCDRHQSMRGEIHVQ